MGFTALPIKTFMGDLVRQQPWFLIKYTTLIVADTGIRRLSLTLKARNGLNILMRIIPGTTAYFITLLWTILSQWFLYLMGATK